MLAATYTRVPTRQRGQEIQLVGTQLGLDWESIPGTTQVANIGRGIFYAGVGTALIVASLFAWKIIDTFFED